MAFYVYEGPGPFTGPEGETVRPLDVRDFDAAPDWGAWRPVVNADALSVTETPAEPAAARPSAPAADKPSADATAPAENGS